jgi:hypothetical protein
MPAKVKYIHAMAANIGDETVVAKHPPVEDQASSSRVTKHPPKATKAAKHPLEQEPRQQSIRSNKNHGGKASAQAAIGGKASA